MNVDENGFFREALRESEERHRVTLQMAMDGFLRADMQGRILEVNETYCRMTGYSEHELLTMAIADVEAVHSAEMIAAKISRLAELRADRIESVHRRKDGSLFDVEISGQYQPIAGGQVVIFVRDITERKRGEQTLQLNELRLHALLQLSRMTEQSVQMITDFALEKAVELTKSKIGYLAFMNEDETVLAKHSWSRTAMEQCGVEGTPRTYLVAETGLWGEAVRQRRPVITNDYASPNPYKKGCPGACGSCAPHEHPGVRG